MRTFFPGKLLLFGEYTVIQGGTALAAPFRTFGGQWATGKPELQQRLQEWGSYLSQLSWAGLLDLQRFAQELNTDGLYFFSDIPTGYGLGSSGALCAACYSRYAFAPLSPDDPGNYPALKNYFAEMESFFHGNSSGVDPLISYLDQPVVLMPEQINPINFSVPELPWQLFLLDSRMPRTTGPLVKHFMERCEDPFFIRLLQGELMPATEEAIHFIRQQRWEELFQAWHEISVFQYRHLGTMIPAELRQAWLDGLSSDHYKLKLCGAGGGGYFLGISANWPLTESLLSSWPLLRW